MVTCAPTSSLSILPGSNYTHLTVVVCFYNYCILLKTHRHSPGCPQTPFWEDPITIPFINKLWRLAEEGQKKTWEHSDADIVKCFYKLPDPFSLHQFTFNSFLCLWKKVYSRKRWRRRWTCPQNTTVWCRHSSGEFKVLGIIFKPPITQNRLLRVSLWFTLSHTQPPLTLLVRGADIQQAGSMPGFK